MRPSRDEMLMEIAQTVAKRSTCSRKNVGTVVAREGRVLTMGYNGAPTGMAHCDHTNDPEMIAQGFAVDRGCTRAVHAEANAIAYAARYGIDVSNSELFTTLSPCLSCAQLVINSGIIRVVCLRVYRDTIGIRLLHDAGLEVLVVDLSE